MFSSWFIHDVVTRTVGRNTYLVDVYFFGSNYGLLPDRRQAITWRNAVILLIGQLGTNFSEIIIKIQLF